MHGGYYSSGSKANMAGLAASFASRGYVAAAINYRLLDQLAPRPGAPVIISRMPDWLPDQLIAWNVSLEQYTNTIAAATEDEAMAIDWLAANAAAYDINPNWLAAGGYSAGAISSLALAAGAIDGVSHAELGAVFSIAGALFGNETGFDSSSPGVFLVHGEVDDVVPFSETPYLEAAMIGAGVPYATLYVPGADHVSPLLEAAMIANEELIFQFMIDQLNPVPEPSTLVLAGLGIGFGLLGLWRKRRTAAWLQQAIRLARP
jgi:acetyl esterase/lipase